MATITGTAGSDSLAGGSGADEIRGLGGSDQLDGKDGVDTLDGGPGADLIRGGGGADRIVTAAGESGVAPGSLDTVLDWASTNVLEFAVAASVVGYFEATASTYAQALALADARIADGSSNVVVVQIGSDTLVFVDTRGDRGGADDAVVLRGRVLSDIAASNFVGPTERLPYPAPPTLSFTGAGGSVSGNMDAVHLSDLIGADIAQSTASRLLLIGDGAQLTLVGRDFTYASDQLVGGTVTSIDFATAGFSANLIHNGFSAAPLLGWVLNDANLQAFSSILLFNDRLGGSAAADLIRGWAGHDVIYGRGGGDTIFGGLGDDQIYATLAPDTNGGIRTGSTYLRGDEGNDYIFGGDGFDDVNGNMGDDIAAGGLGDDWVVGGKDQDLLFGDAGNDLVYGNLGSDTCEGGEGADIVRGGQDDDIVRGGAGNDFVSGDKGSDTMTGGAGADIFHTFGEAGVDRVTDFSLAEGDRVQVDPGTQYTLAQVGADTVINMTGGGQMVLVGVQLSSLTPGWIFGA